MILLWQCKSLQNRLRALFSDRPVEMSFVCIGALLVLTANAAGFYASLVDSAPMLREQWLSVALAGLAASALMGGAIGYGLGRWASAKTKAPWIAVLPWPDSARKRAARSAALILSSACAAIAASCGWIVTNAVGAHAVFLSGLLTGLVFVVPAASAAVLGSSDADLLEEPYDRAQAPARPSWISIMAIRLDRSSPRWVGLWAQNENSQYLPAWWVGSLVILGGVAAAITIAQWQPWPSLGMAVIGGNLAFMATLNGRPLLSPVLRSTAAGYGAVWVALIRVPAALSLAWFAAATLPAIVVSAHHGGETAGALLVLSLLDLLSCASVALNPSSRPRAAIIYVILLAVIAYQGLTYGISYGMLAIAIILAALAVLWSRARIRFRLNG